MVPYFDSKKYKIIFHQTEKLLAKERDLLSNHPKAVLQIILKIISLGLHTSLNLHSLWRGLPEYANADTVLVKQFSTGSFCWLIATTRPSYLLDTYHIDQITPSSIPFRCDCRVRATSMVDSTFTQTMGMSAFLKPPLAYNVNLPRDISYRTSTPSFDCQYAVNHCTTLCSSLSKWELYPWCLTPDPGLEVK